MTLNFDDNSKLLSSVIENELDNIEKSGVWIVWMRLLAKIEIFFMQHHQYCY
jgi:hypothetical protein